MLNFDVKSHTGLYSVTFNNELIGSNQIATLGTHYIIDRNVAKLLDMPIGENCVLIDATEDTKSYQGIEPIITELLGKNLKRDSVLVAIGGGITQDIACFVATTFMRGIKWVFVPTTVLAQADSCIGSKSSINFGPYKNLLGSFTPPNQIIISDQFLATLEDKDIKSGIGEIIKLFLVADIIAPPGIINRSNISDYIYNALQIKKEYIEIDEFDKGVRNILNYGHCIGHGIESATNFAIPHGIAITIGMDVVNRLAVLDNLITEARFNTIHHTLYENYKEYSNVPINIDAVCRALTKDKKNTGSKINLVLPAGDAIEKRGFENESAFWALLHTALSQTPVTVQS